MTVGHVHSIESMGLVDGPGIRTVIFLQGCALRCRFCHNPDTWELSGGTEYTPEELVAKIRRFKPYFKEDGGVTFSGGTSSTRKYAKMNSTFWRVAAESHLAVENLYYNLIF